MFKILASILHLGNVLFDTTTVSSPHPLSLNVHDVIYCNYNDIVCCTQVNGQDGVTLSSEEGVKTVADLLLVELDQLKTQLMYKVTLTRGEYFHTPLSLDQALETRWV